MQKRCTVDLWTAGCAGSRLTAPARSPMDKPWATRRVAHRLPTGRRLPTSSTALNPIDIKSGKVKTKSPAPALAYSSPVTVQTTGTTANLKKHGYDFEDAPQVIESDHTVTFEDRRFAYDEQRFITLGMLRGEVVVIATAETDEEIRLISMRKAERNEQEIYYSNI